MAEVIGAAAIAALAHHRMETAGGECRKALQRLADEGQIRIDPRWSSPRPNPGQPGLGQHARHGAMMHLQLRGDGAGGPLLGVIIAQDLRLDFRGNGHALLFFWQRLAEPGGAESLGERNPDSGSHTSGIAMRRPRKAVRKWRAVCRRQVR